GRLHDLAMNQVAGGIASERVAFEFGRQQIAAVDIDTASSRELAGVQVGSCPRPANWKNAGLLAPGGDVVHRRGYGDARIGLEVAIFDHNVADRIAIGAVEAIAPVIKAKPELAVACHRLTGAGQRMKTKIHAAD